MAEVSLEAKGDASLSNKVQAGEKPEIIASATIPDPRPEDSSTTKAELRERKYGEVGEDEPSRPAKRVKVGDELVDTMPSSERQKGVAPVKSE